MASCRCVESQMCGRGKSIFATSHSLSHILISAIHSPSLTEAISLSDDVRQVVYAEKEVQLTRLLSGIVQESVIVQALQENETFRLRYHETLLHAHHSTEI